MNKKEEIDKLILQDRQERENRCAQRFSKLMAKFQKEVLDVERCDMDIQMTHSAKFAPKPGFVFYARD